MSLTVPDQGQSNAVIVTDPHTKVVTCNVTYLTRKYVLGEYPRVSFQTKEYTVELEDIMSAKHPVTLGGLFWKRAMQEVHNKTMQALTYEQDYAKTYDADERPLVSVKKNWMPMMTWKDYWELLINYYWEGEHYAGTQPSDLSKEVRDIMYQVKNKRLHLSRMAEWQFNNLNASFEKVVGTSKRTLMVSSDVVESSVVESGKFHLLREVQLLRTGEGESTVEPLHHQWIKVRGNHLEIVEVEIASTSGPLAILPLAKPW